VLVAAGDQVADALAVSRLLAEQGAHVVVGLGSEEGVRAAAEALGGDAAGERRGGSRPRSSTGRARRACATRSPGRRTAIGVGGRRARRGTRAARRGGAPAFGAWRFRGSFAEATDADVVRSSRASSPARWPSRGRSTAHWSDAADGARPRAVFLTNGSDGGANAYNDVLRAATEELVRVWRDESETDRAGAASRARCGATRSSAGATRNPTRCGSPRGRRPGCSSRRGASGR
jgi:malonyl-CoA reductase/3-hydroxypropionate dehydrogenase (NADP+)